MPYVENRKTWNGHWPEGRALYIGRRTRIAQTERQRGAMNGTALGNHHYAGLDRYEEWLRERIEARDASVLAAIDMIRDDTILVCSCAPAPCHGDVVLKVWRERQQPKKIRCSHTWTRRYPGRNPNPITSRCGLEEGHEGEHGRYAPIDKPWSHHPIGHTPMGGGEVDACGCCGQEIRFICPNCGHGLNTPRGCSCGCGMFGNRRRWQDHA